VDVDVGVAREGDGRYLVQLAGDEWEVAIRLTEADLHELVRSAHWSERGTLRAGESAAGSPVSWASDGDQARLLIGPDDEARDVAVTIPFRVVTDIVRGVLRVQPQPDSPGGTTVREPRRPRPNAPLAGAVELAIPDDPDD
jgi:hypothetical protein